MSLDAWIEEQNLFEVTKHLYCAGTDIAPGGNFRSSSDSCQIKEVLECGAPGGNFRPSSDSCQIKEVLVCGAPGEGHSVRRHLEEQRYQSRVALGDTCPPPGSLEAHCAWRLVSSARRFW